jgi:hypothetical protein
MSGISFGSIVSMASQIALAAATGGMSAAIQMALKAVVTSIIQQVIQQVGQQMGLPQGVIDMAQQAFSAASSQPGGANVDGAIGALGQLMGANPSQVGQAQREGNEIVKQMVDSILKRARDGGSDEDGASGPESRLMKLAKAMGKLLDKKMDQMIAVGAKMDKSEKQGALSAQMQALGQELGMISNALNNTIKSIGESNTTLARKG